MVILAIIVCGVIAPIFVDEIFDLLSEGEHARAQYSVFLWCYYPCGLLGILTVLLLMGMLKRIKNDEPFTRENVLALRLISLCCFLVAIITFAGAFVVKSFILVSMAAGFFGLILRVVKNVIQRAVELKEENDLTI